MASPRSRFVQEFLRLSRDVIVPALTDVAWKVQCDQAKCEVVDNPLRPSLSVLPVGMRLPPGMEDPPCIAFVPLEDRRTVHVVIGGAELVGSSSSYADYLIGEIDSEFVVQKAQAFLRMMVGWAET